MKNKAFTILEMLIVIAIFGLIMALVIPNCARMNENPKLNGTVIKKEYELHHGIRGGDFPYYYVTIVETNRYSVSEDLYNHVSEGQYVWHE